MFAIELSCFILFTSVTVISFHERSRYFNKLTMVPLYVLNALQVCLMVFSTMFMYEDYVEERDGEPVHMIKKHAVTENLI